MSDRPTPETDACWDDRTGCNILDHARRLERERDEARPLRFSFDGRSLEGCAGDTLASALLANGQRLVGRSFKYHRPRGILSAGPEEPNALVELRGGARREPNTRATMAELYDGLEAQSQNRWPSLRVDLMALNGLFSPLLGAGFYYKTFMWPAAFWEKVYEPLIRRAAGLGSLSTASDPDHYEKATAFCDVLVIGSGPAGLMAALTAARSGARVIVAEQDFLFGGQCLGERREIGGGESVQRDARLPEQSQRVGELTGQPRQRVADHRQQPVPDGIAGQRGVGIARILDPGEAAGGRVGMQRLALQREQRAQQADTVAQIGSGDAGESVEPAAAGQREPHRLELIVGRVRGQERRGARDAGGGEQQRVALAARPLLDAVAARRCAARPQAAEGDTERLGLRRAVREPVVGGGLQPVVHVQRQHAGGPEQPDDRMQQDGGIEAAAEGDRDRSGGVGPCARVRGIRCGERRTERVVNRFP